jgi:hypothetical protein
MTLCGEFVCVSRLCALDSQCVGVPSAASTTAYSFSLLVAGMPSPQHLHSALWPLGCMASTLQHVESDLTVFCAVRPTLTDPLLHI